MVQFAYSSENTHLSAQKLKINNVYWTAIDFGALSFRLAAVIDDYLHEIEIKKFGGSQSEKIAVNGMVQFAYSVKNTHLPAQELDDNDVYWSAINFGALSLQFPQCPIS